MRRPAHIGLLLLLLALPCAAQEVVDRIVAVVGNHIITQSDWEEQERFEAMAQGRPAADVQRSAATLERLIDRLLIDEQIEDIHFQRAAPPQVSEQLTEIRKQLPAAQTDEGWRKLLDGYSISEEDLAHIVSEQVDDLRFIEMRFRSGIHIAPYEIENYYNQILVPELKKTGTSAAAPPAKETEASIRRILIEQRLNELVGSWLQSLRAQANIQRLVATGVASTATQPAAGIGSK